MKIVNVEGMFLFALMMFFSLFVNSAEGALAPCIEDPATGNQIPYNIIIQKDVTPSMPEGTVFGKIVTATNIYIKCKVSSARWDLELKPSAPSIITPDRMDTLCQTNIPGIGITYVSGYGHSMRCSSVTMMLWLDAGYAEQNFPQGRTIGLLIRTKTP